MSQVIAPETEQISATEQEISDLKAELAEKNQRIAQLEKENAQLKELSTLDEKTGLLNEKSINVVIDAEIEKRQRAVEKNEPYEPLSVLFLDLDNLKRFNDMDASHKTGDKAILSSGQAIANSIRTYDSGGHLHGDEFIIIINGDLKAAILAAQRIRGRASIAGKDNELSVSPTFSIGITEFHPGDSRDTLKRLADQAMYQVKNNGKNGIAVSGASEERLQEVVSFINSSNSQSGLFYNSDQCVFRDVIN